MKKHRLHSGNYIEQLDVLRNGIIGAITGFLIGLIVVAIISYNQYFPPEIPNITYFFIVLVLTMFCTWEGGLIGIANENKKLEEFQDDLNNGKYLILIYARSSQESIISDNDGKKTS